MSDCGDCTDLPVLYLGDVFKVTCQYESLVEPVVPLDQLVVISQLRNPYTKQKVADLTVNILDLEHGLFELVCQNTNTEAFQKLDHVIWNIRYMYPDGPRSTEVFKIPLDQGATSDD